MHDCKQVLRKLNPVGPNEAECPGGEETRSRLTTRQISTSINF